MLQGKKKYNKKKIRFDRKKNKWMMKLPKNIAKTI
jgi:hypothetical protein